MALRIKPETVVLLIAPAAARGISVHDLAHQLLDTIASDRMVDAVLDDADELVRVALLKGGQ